VKSTVLNKGDHYELSVYTGKLTFQTVFDNVEKLMLAFPQLDENWYDIFQQRIMENEFSDERLNDAVNHVIDTCPYPQPTIANFISFDKRVTLYTYDQIVKMVNEHGSGIFKIYRPVKIGNHDRPFYARTDDIEKYKLTPWKK